MMMIPELTFKFPFFAMDERLSSYGLIARASIERSVPLLTRVFLECFARLQQGRGTADPTATLEELYSLLLICGHVLADEEEGGGTTALFYILLSRVSILR